MEAKTWQDTVMSPEQTVKMRHKWEIRDAQAEITWPIAFEVGSKEGVEIGRNEAVKIYSDALTNADLREAEIKQQYRDNLKEAEESTAREILDTIKKHSEVRELPAGIHGFEMAYNRYYCISPHYIEEIESRYLKGKKE